MTDFARDINTICTHADLVNALGSANAVRRISPDTDEVPDPTDPTKTIREEIYREVLIVLATRVPPIRESEISKPKQLREVVLYGTLARLNFNAITVDNDVHHVRFKHWDGLYSKAIDALKLDVGSAEVSGGSIELERG